MCTPSTSISLACSSRGFPDGFSQRVHAIRSLSLANSGWLHPRQTSKRIDGDIGLCVPERNAMGSATKLTLNSVAAIVPMATRTVIDVRKLNAITTDSFDFSGLYGYGHGSMNDRRIAHPPLVAVQLLIAASARWRSASDG
jgi:hypothetical protein